MARARSGGRQRAGKLDFGFVADGDSDAGKAGTTVSLKGRNYFCNVTGTAGSRGNTGAE